MKEFIVNTGQLADVFGVSTRQIENLVTAGVIEQVGTAKSFRFDLFTVVPQYATFLMSGESLRDWCADV